MPGAQPADRSFTLEGRRAVRRTGLAFQRLGSRPHRPDDLGDGSPRHPSRLLPNRRARAQQSTPLLKTRLDDGCSWWFKKISDVERLESPSARLARRLVLNDPSSLSVRHLRSATAERPFRKSGTDGSNPVPSSGESVSAVDSRAVGEKPRAFAPVCTGSGTREGDGLAVYPLIWPFLSDGH